ncbi:hypothetical protein BDQ17DRAFT_603930 [Cyathus striatus]|nr:hypothetical protein BDQ17DRAFT_603930 [Cyathus striatus]
MLLRWRVCTACNPTFPIPCTYIHTTCSVICKCIRESHTLSRQIIIICYNPYPGLITCYCSLTPHGSPRHSHISPFSFFIVESSRLAVFSTPLSPPLLVNHPFHSPRNHLPCIITSSSRYLLFAPSKHNSSLFDIIVRERVPSFLRSSSDNLNTCEHRIQHISTPFLMF